MRDEQIVLSHSEDVGSTHTRSNVNSNSSTTLATNTEFSNATTITHLSNYSSQTLTAMNDQVVKDKDAIVVDVPNKPRIEALTSMNHQYYLDTIKDFVDDNGSNNLDDIMKHLLTEKFCNFSNSEIVRDFKERIKSFLKHEICRQYVS